MEKNSNLRSKISREEEVFWELATQEDLALQEALWDSSSRISKEAEFPPNLVHQQRVFELLESGQTLSSENLVLDAYLENCEKLREEMVSARDHFIRLCQDESEKKIGF